MDTGELVRFVEGAASTLPPPVAELTDYYIRATSATAMQLYPTRADAIADTNAITFSGAGTGTGHRVTSSVIDIALHGYSGGEGPLTLSNSGGALR